MGQWRPEHTEGDPLASSWHPQRTSTSWSQAGWQPMAQLGSEGTRARGSEASLSQCKVVAIEGPGKTHSTAHLTDKAEKRVSSGSGHNRDIQTIAYQLS